MKKLDLGGKFVGKIDPSSKSRKWSWRLRFFRRRTIPCPTWTCWFCLIAILVLFVYACFFFAESFLAETDRVPADTLVVEGWIGRNGLRAAADEFWRGGYLYIVAAGGLTSGRWEDQPQSYAEMAANELIRLGIPRERVTVATSEKTERYRTFESAVAVRRTLHLAGIKPKGLNIFTFGPHARRSAMVFKKVNWDVEKIGVIGWCPPEYQKERWWESSERSKELIDEAVGYLYEVLLNSGRLTNSPELSPAQLLSLCGYRRKWRV
jgi:uncharacterized SAM-binding protein YcdF (DUF218 family)